jgi:hypothetical protein
MELMLTRVATAIRYLAIISFAAFVFTAICLGGDALNGHTESGRYFLSWHGRSTEVSSTVFNYSRFHALASIALMVLAAGSVLLSKPDATEIKWQGRLTVVIVGLAALSFYKYGA